MEVLVAAVESESWRPRDAVLLLVALLASEIFVVERTPTSGRRSAISVLLKGLGWRRPCSFASLSAAHSPCACGGVRPVAPLTGLSLFCRRPTTIDMAVCSRLEGSVGMAARSVPRPRRMDSFSLVSRKPVGFRWRWMDLRRCELRERW